MTPEDYAEIGIPVPPHMWAQVHRVNEPERCEECGDEQGECGCSE